MAVWFGLLILHSRFRANEYSTEDHPTDPISACTSALVGDFSTIAMSAADFPRDVFKAARGKGKSTEKLVEDPSAETSQDGDSNALTRASRAGSTATLPQSSGGSASSNALGMQPEINSSQPSLAPASGTSGHSRTPSESNPASHQRAGSKNENLERALGAGRSLNNIVATGMKSPMNFCLGLARGFRNAPTLYNDDTVRPVEKVTSFTSGLKVAGKEFGFGIFDGITGLVTQPIRGAEKDGGMGLLKGFSKGIGGFMLKPAAGELTIIPLMGQRTNGYYSFMVHSSIHHAGCPRRNSELIRPKCSEIYYRFPDCSRPA